MKIEIYKKNNDENIYFSYNQNLDKILNFENLKDFSIMLLNNKIIGQEVNYDVLASADLAIYKTTVEDIISNIVDDNELFDLYKEKVSNAESEILAQKGE